MSWRTYKGLHFNGIDPRTGRASCPSLTLKSLANQALAAVPEEFDSDFACVANARRLQEQMRPCGWVVDASDLSQAGWAYVLPHNQDSSIREALEPLFQHRWIQVGRDDLFRELQYRPEESAMAFLARHSIVAGPVNPERLPYYLLLVGHPGEISFDFQHQLATQFAVGRIALESPDDYASYAQSVVEAETGQRQVTKEAVFFASAHRGDDSTQASLNWLVKPLAQKFQERSQRFDWDVDRFFAKRASKERLGKLLTSPPELLFTASHGLCSMNPDDAIPEVEGALVCSDWPGPSGWESGNPILREHFFSAEDVPCEANLTGTLFLSFACNSAGSPEGLPDESPAVPATLSCLPQRLLAHPKGGILAFVGHVGPAWSCVFTGPQGLSHVDLFESTLVRLLQGQTIGAAMDDFAARHTELAASLASKACASALVSPGNRETESLAALWSAYRDVRSYVILGDPAVRLSSSSRRPQ